MKPSSFFSLLGLAALMLTGCKRHAPQVNSAIDDEARRKLEDTRAAYAKKAADMEARSNRLAEDLAALQRSVQDKENAELNAKLEVMRAENDRLQADAEEARQRSDEIGEQLAVVAETPDEAPEAAAWSDPSADYSTFYEELNPYGRWLDVEGYGYAWRPNLADRVTWRPYVDGRWDWSDQGWAWDSNEPFGWACYHYGRWIRLAGRGWVWVPGRDWAPAWVSWRTGSDCIGWAPLPPGHRRHGRTIGPDCDSYYHLSPSSYTFIQAQNFGRPSYVNVSLPLSSATELFVSTSNVTNIIQVNYQQANLFVHRGGPDRDWLERRLGGPVPRAAVQVMRNLDRSQWRMPTGRGANGDVVQLPVAPIPPARPGRTGAPARLERIARPALADAWADVPADRRAELRNLINRQSQNTKPVAATNAGLVSTAPGRRLETPAIPTPQSPPPTSVVARPETPGRIAPRARDGFPADLPQGGLNKDASSGVQQAANAAAMQRQQEQERLQAEANAAMERGRVETQLAAEVRQRREAERARMSEEAMAQAQQQNQRQADMAIQERHRRQMQGGLVDSPPAEGNDRQAREAAAVQQQQMARQQAAAQALQQQQIDQRLARDNALRQQQQENARSEAMANQAAAERAREAMQRSHDDQLRQQQALAAQRQQEMANAAALRAQQEAAQRQAAEAERQNAMMRQQQEAAQQRAAQEAQQRAAQEASQRAAAQEAARRAAEDAARRSADDAARKQRDDSQRRDDNPRRSR